MDQILLRREYRLLIFFHSFVVWANPINGREEESTPEEKEQLSITSSADESLNDNRDTSSDSEAADEINVPTSTERIANAEDDRTDINPQSRIVNIKQENIANIQWFGSPGPPRLNIAKDLDELTLEDEQLNSKIDESEREIESLPQTLHPLYPRPIHSLSTLSQDDMTMDAEMGRPPRITNAGAMMGLQQDDEREKTRQKNAVETRDTTTFTELLFDRKASGESKNVKSDKGRKDEKDEIESFIKALAKSLNQPQPTLKMFDAAVVYDKADYENVKDFIDELRRLASKELSEDLRIELFDSEEFVQSMVMVVADVVDRCSMIFVYLTSNSTSEQFRLFCDEAIGMSRLSLNDPAINSGMAVNDRKWILKPVHTLPQNRRTYQTPVGLLTLNGLDWYDWPSRFVTDKAIALLKSAIVQRKSREVERNTSLGYKQTFGERCESYKSSYPSHLTKSEPAQGPKLSMNSVDAMSLPTQTAHPMAQTHVQAPRQQSIHQMYPGHQSQHQQTNFMPQQFPLQQNYPTYPERDRYPSQIPYVQHQQQPDFDIYRPNQYAVQHAHPYLQGQQNINGFSTVPQHNPMYRNLPVQPSPFIQNSHVPPPYSSIPMQDNLSYPQSQNNQYPLHYRGPPEHVHYDTSRRYVPHGYTSTVPHGYITSEHTGYRGQENSQFQTRQTNQYQPTHVRRQQPGAALGSLMMDQTHDTPASNDLKVVSRVTGKLITNPDLSNNDLEIDTNERPDVMPNYKHNIGELKTEDTDESSDDSEADSDDFESGIKAMFPKKGKVINVIGSSVVQIGRHNKTIEKYRTKRVFHVEQKAEKRKEEHFDKVPVHDDTVSHTSEKGKGNFVIENVRHSLTQTDQKTHNSNGHSMDMRPSFMDEKQDSYPYEVTLPAPETPMLSKSVDTVKKQEISNTVDTMFCYSGDKLRNIADNLAENINDFDRCPSIEDNTIHTLRPYTSVTEEVVDEEEMFGTGRQKQTQPAQFAFSSFRTSMYSPMGFTRTGDNYAETGILINKHDTSNTSAENNNDID